MSILKILSINLKLNQLHSAGGDSNITKLNPSVDFGDATGTTLLMDAALRINVQVV